MTPITRVDPSFRLGRTLAILMLAGTSFSLMQSMLVPALPAVRDHLGATASGTAWVLTVFLLSSSILTPIVGRAGDLYGTQRILVAVLALFSVGIVLSAVSSTLPEMLAGRVIQGVGAGVFPLAFSIVRSRFPKNRTAGGIGAISSVVGIGGGLGLVLPGIILKLLGFQWLFWIPLGLNIIALAAVLLWIPQDKTRTDGTINLISALFMGLGFSGILVTITELQTWGLWSIITGVISATSVVLWIRHDLRSQNPLIAMSVMRIRSVWSANLAAFLVGAAMFGSFLLIPLFAESPSTRGFGFGASVLFAGVLMIPTAVPQLVLGPLAGRLDRAIGSRTILMVGTFVLTASFVVLVTSSASIFGIVVATTLIGIGLGLAIPALANVTVNAVPSQHVGAATAMNTVIRNLGGAFGTQIGSTILVFSAVGSSPQASGYLLSFTALGIGAALSAVATFIVTVGRRAFPTTKPDPQ